MTELTQAERKILNRAHAIIAKHTAYGASWMIGIQHYRGCRPSFDLTYFDGGPLHEQHSGLRGATFADKVQTALDIEAKDAITEEERRRLRAEMLRKELAELTGEDVPA